MPCTASSESPVAVEIIMLNGLYIKSIFSAIEVCNIVFEHPTVPAIEYVRSIRKMFKSVFFIRF